LSITINIYRKRLEKLEKNIVSKNKIHVAIIGTDDDGTVFYDGKQYTQAEFEKFKVAHGVEVVINMGDLLNGG